MESTTAGAQAPSKNEYLTPALGVGLLVAAIVFLWQAPSSYEIYKALHVFAAVVWVGGGTALTLMALASQRRRDPAGLAAVAKQAEWLGMKVFTPASFVVLAFGIAMIEKGDLGWGHFWIDFALAAWAFSTFVGIVLLSPKVKRLNTLLEEQPVESPEVQAAIARLLLTARVDIVILLLIVVDMTAKPFA